jgi:uncharacterized protein (DUF608 family)
MNRAGQVRTIGTALSLLLWVGGFAGRVDAADADRLFPARLPSAQWEQFRATAYSRPVTGIIYRGEPRPVSGLPLGGIASGYLDLETAGTFGYSTIFNYLTPRGGPLNTPFLGISVGGRTWVLTTGETKQYDPGQGPPPPPGPSLAIRRVEQAKSIDYWGHYPIADVEYETSAPVSVGLRAWSAFIPGNAAVSDTPGAVFEVHLRNHTAARQTGTVAFSLPGFSGHQSALDPEWTGPNPRYARVPATAERQYLTYLPQHKIVREVIQGDPSGVWVRDKNWKMSYVLGVMGGENSRTGADLGIDGKSWSAIEKQLPQSVPETGGASLAVDFTLEAGQTKTVRFVLAWYAPEWKGDGAPDTAGNTYTRMYATRFANALEVARSLTTKHENLLRRIIRWQEEVYSTPEIPGWLADALINNLSLIAKTAMWAQAKPPIGPWCKPEDGLFAMNESPRSCSQMDTSPNSAVGNLPLVYFFPALERSTLRALKEYQFSDGRPPLTLGSGGGDKGFYFEMVYPGRGYQLVMQGSNYMVRLDRYWKVTGEDDFLKEFYDSARRATRWSFSLRPPYGLSQIVAMPTEGTDPLQDTEWYEDRPYYGYVCHPGGYRMAHAEMMRRWAKKRGDTELVEELDAWLEAGAQALEQYLWTGNYYRVYYEPETGRHMDVFFVPQLDGQLFARLHGLPGVFPEDHVEKVLEMIRKGSRVSKLGIPPAYVTPEGAAWQPDDQKKYLTGMYTFEEFATYFLAETFMYEGQKNFGLDLLHRCLEAFSCKYAYTWDGANVFSHEDDTGERSYGTDYYQNMCLWDVPAALKGEDMSGPSKPGGLVYRMIQAGKGN